MRFVGPDAFQQVIIVKLGEGDGRRHLRTLPGAFSALCTHPAERRLRNGVGRLLIGGLILNT